MAKATKKRPGRKAPRTGKKRQCSFAIDPALLKRVDSSAAKLGVTRSELLGELVSDAMESVEAEAKLLSNPRVMKAFAEAIASPGVMRAMTEAMRLDVAPEQAQQVLEFFRKAGGDAK